MEEMQFPFRERQSHIAPKLSSDSYFALGLHFNLPLPTRSAWLLF